MKIEYIEENGITANLDILSNETGISPKNINRFLNYGDYNNSNGGATTNL